MKYFTIKELSSSVKADQLGIKNEPNSEQIANLTELVNNVLDKIREQYGKPITITSGFRCPALNAAIGGSTLSDHVKGCAADLANNVELQAVIVKMIKDRRIEFDQFIIEKPNKEGIGQWLHISYRKSKNRNQTMIFDGKRYYITNIY